MNKSWSEVLLGEVVKHRKEFFEIDDLEEYKRCRVKLHAQGIQLRDKVSGSLIKTKKQQRCHENDFLVAEIDAKVGGYGIVPVHLDGAIVSSHYFLYSVDGRVLDPNFLAYFARTQNFADQISAKGSTNYAAIRPDHVLNYKIKLPPIPVQKHIVEHLDAIEERLKRVQRLREKAFLEIEALTTSLHFSLAGGRQAKLDQLLFLDEEQETIEPDGSYPQAGIRSFGMGMFTKPAVKGSDTSYRVFNVLRTDKFVMSQVKGWEGAVSVVCEDLNGWYVSPEYRTFSCIDSECDPDYLSFLVSTTWFRSQLAAATRGVGARRERVRPEKLLALEIPFPLIDKQRNAAKILQHLGTTRRLRINSLASEDVLLPSIIDSVFDTKK